MLYVTLVSCTFNATKVFAHRWPHDTAEWTSDFRNLVDAKINLNNNNKNADSSKFREITLSDNSINLAGYLFESIQNVGVSVPFFKKECRLMFEGRYLNVHAHVHVYVALEDDYIHVFNSIVQWLHEQNH